MLRTLTPILFLLASLSLCPVATVQAQAEVIDTESNATTDEQIAARIQNIFQELGDLDQVTVTVDSGVVTLAGEVANSAAAERAIGFSERVQGVVTVQDDINRTLAVGDNIEPLLDDIRLSASNAVRAMPLYVTALLVFLIIAYLAHKLGLWRSLWSRTTSNPFLLDLIGQAVRLTGIVIGIVVALNMIGANALIGTVLGSAGVLGLAIGFAVRDTLENYLASIMLSLRQPFRARDHVLINDSEGIVVRLTSRATILMTLDGNHLRIPNADVYKAIILNYSTNPQRRITFELGVDAEDDPVAAIETGLEQIRALDFVLDDPPPSAVISTVGDSNIVLEFRCWIDQEATDFSKGRSLAIRATMRHLNAEGFTLPEPIYRLRFDDAAPVLSDQQAVEPDGEQHEAKEVEPSTTADDLLDTRPEQHIQEIVDAERSNLAHEDLLRSSARVE